MYLNIIRNTPIPCSLNLAHPIHVLSPPLEKLGANTLVIFVNL